MSSQHREPRLEEMLADSIIKAVMEADGVELACARGTIAANRGAIAGDTGHAGSTGTRTVRSS